ncbi:DUF859 family phage minor structural protein [Pseudoramibacter porci]|uniref:Baseplate structural protein Gp10 C-terminal domain-containing protein n=1 Tax=Pseudoramibacter porci TaxID=2606631 RepID=A0A7X2T8V3_9FIRM|nr:DUF859 family phage minor structural protein [Pseudoramibacter porci]MSS18879.1 hypothetical protein [Pseudoramibacter porci]
MASGSISGSTSNRYIVAQINWQASANVSGNYSDVSAQLFYRRTNSGYTTSGTIGGVIDIDGTDYGYGGHVSIGTGWVQVASASKRVYHNNDGTKGIWIGATGGISGTSMSSTSCGSGVNLDTIPRASGMSLSTSNVAAGGSFTVNISPHSSGFSHWIDITGVGDQITYEVAAGVTSCTCTIPKKRVTTFPNSQSAQATVFLNTKTGSGHDTKIGVVSQAITVTVPSDVKPSIGSVTLADATKAYSVMGAYAASFSQVTATVPASVYHTDFTDTATIKSVSAVYNSTTYDATSGTFKFYPNAAGTANMTITATDSRGMTAIVTKAITVKTYSPPTVSVNASRCTSSGTADDTGAYANVTIPATLDSTNVSGNSATVTLQYRPIGSTSAWTSVSVGTITKTQTLTKRISASDTQAFDLVASITDKITSNSAAMTLSNAQVPLDFLKGGKGIAVGKTATREGLDIAFPIYVEGRKVYVDGKTILDKFFPIGKTWISTDPTSPASIVGGSWEQIKDRFLLAAGSTFSAGSTGGSATHEHWYGFVLCGYYGNFVGENGPVGALQRGENGKPAGMSNRLADVTVTINNGTQKSTHSDNSARYESRAVTSSNSSMPPYFVVYMWQRIA